MMVPSPASRSEMPPGAACVPPSPPPADWEEPTSREIHCVRRHRHSHG